MVSPHTLEVLSRAVESGDVKEITKLLAQDPSLLDTTCKNSLNSVGGSGHEGSARQSHRNLVVQIFTKWPD